MKMTDTICVWIGELVPFFFSFLVFLYGVFRFFKKGKALYLKIVTMAMGCYALSYLYHICQHLVINEIAEGFTPAYLGRIGFYLFLLTANFGQMNGLLDDGSKKMMPSRFIGLIGPLVAAILYAVFIALEEAPTDSKITYLIVWVPAMFVLYYNLKHAVIPDLGYGFVKAVRPYNISSFILCFIDLLLLCLWFNYDYDFGNYIISALSVAFGIMSVITVRNLEKGVNKWKI